MGRKSFGTLEKQAPDYFVFGVPASGLDLCSIPPRFVASFQRWWFLTVLRFPCVVTLQVNWTVGVKTSCFSPSLDQ